MDPFTQVNAGKLKSINSQLPYKFARGSQISGFDGRCWHCDQLLQENMIRGILRKKSKSKVEILAVGFCENCQKYSKYEYLIKDDLTFSDIVRKPKSKFLSNFIPFMVGFLTFIYLWINYR